MKKMDIFTKALRLISVIYVVLAVICCCCMEATAYETIIISSIGLGWYFVACFLDNEDVRRNLEKDE